MVASAARIEVLVPGVRLAKMPAPSTVPAASPSAKGKKSEKESRSRAASSEPSSQKPDSKKKEKEPMPEEEEEEESTAEDTGSLEEGVDSEEEPSTLPPEPTPRMGLHLIGKKKPPPIYKSPVASNCSSKIPRKGEGSNKKPRGK